MRLRDLAKRIAQLEEAGGGGGGGPIFHPGAWETLDAATFPTGAGFLNIDALSVPYEIEMVLLRDADWGDVDSFITLNDWSNNDLMDQTLLAPANAGITSASVRSIMPGDHGARFLANGDASGFAILRFRRRPLVV